MLNDVEVVPLDAMVTVSVSVMFLAKTQLLYLFLQSVEKRRFRLRPRLVIRPNWCPLIVWEVRRLWIRSHGCIVLIPATRSPQNLLSLFPPEMPRIRRAFFVRHNKLLLIALWIRSTYINNNSTLADFVADVLA
jgi:hypothetical protein